MTPERWQQVDEIFQTAIELNPAERAAFVETSCAGDEELRREVVSLITSDEQGLSFIDAPAYEVAAGLLLSETPELHEGQHIGHYQIVSMLGVGGMGEVYLAQDTTLGRQIALKLLPTEFTGNPERLRRFQQEALAVSTLNHPNILTLYETGEFEGQQFIATEFVEGETLRQRMKRSRLTVQEVLEIAVQIMSALDAAHHGGIVHRDIKPENVMLRVDGYVKVLDFGLAKLSMLSPFEELTIARTQGYTQVGIILGTTRYMSPEQARGLPVDARTDLWSAGVVVYEMLSGELPFTGETNSDVIANILKDEPTRLVTLSTRLSVQLQTILERALNKDSAARYQNAQGMHADLEDALKAASRADAQLARVATPSDSLPKKKVALRKLIASVLLLALLAALSPYVYQRIRRSRLDLSPVTAENFRMRGGISRWSGDGDSDDSGGNGNNLILSNGAHFAEGKFGQAFAFEGGDDNAQAPTKGFPIGNADRTLEMWVRLDAFVGEENFFGGYGRFGSHTQTYSLSAGGSTLLFSQWGDAVFGRDRLLEVGKWYHIAVTNEGNSVTLYLDGTTLKTGDVTINTSAGTPFIIGWPGSTYGEIRKLQGAVDEVRVYNRALAAEEIAANYAAAK